jgi:hypothetical protein
MNLNQLHEQRQLRMWHPNIYTKCTALGAILMVSLYSFLILLKTEYFAYGSKV